MFPKSYMLFQWYIYLLCISYIIQTIIRKTQTNYRLLPMTPNNIKNWVGVAWNLTWKYSALGIQILNRHYISSNTSLSNTANIYESNSRINILLLIRLILCTLQDKKRTNRNLYLETHMHKFALRIDPLRSPCLFIACTTCGEKLDNLVVDLFLTINFGWM